MYTTHNEPNSHWKLQISHCFSKTRTIVHHTVSLKLKPLCMSTTSKPTMQHPMAKTYDYGLTCCILNMCVLVGGKSKSVDLRVSRSKLSSIQTRVCSRSSFGVCSRHCKLIWWMPHRIVQTRARPSHLKQTIRHGFTHLIMVHFFSHTHFSLTHFALKTCTLQMTCHMRFCSFFL